ncbi:MAG TPA: c-type cytochrome [Casimicrobiaceae bacterium]|nr:c-type cytochrome [Casimicrobiaceae bacterium]
MTPLGAAVLATVLSGFAAVAAAQTATSTGEARTPGEERAINLCSTCHGPRGISTSPEFPILAAQQQAYLVAQLEAFQRKTREEKAAHDFMWGIAGNLDAATIRSIAQYYSSQPPAAGRPGDPALIAKGRELFTRGLPDRGIPRCTSCHGPTAEGAAEFPRLAGQHAKYVRRQLEYIQALTRKAPVMHGIVKDLTPGEIEAIALYVQSL